ncbi:zinc finger hit domain-containing protein 3-like protein [Lasius niger]|uniref:Zinc finger hit domain-containing protein 3-like protein n=1 Tax=Lasius niger TaxID=67767 RepID=A0A0J7KWJ4_LASNI|nr:zinc finger hit domain-containing protein 3-like protein [Lasius niger]
MAKRYGDLLRFLSGKLGCDCCSVTCCKEHKNQTCEPPKLPEEPIKHESIREYKFPTEDTVLVEKLQQLQYSKELKECLKRPDLRDIMKAVLNNPNPTEAIASAMRMPLFVEMADVCLKIVEPSDAAKPC